MNEDVLSAVPVLDGPRLVARLRPALVRFFRRRTGNVADAEDLAQDVLVSALKHADWATPERAKGYIFRAAINRLRDRRRRTMTRGVAVHWDDESSCAAAENTLERALIVREELSELDRALDSLEIRTRTILVLIKLEHRKATEVAEMLGISVRAVNKQLQKALVQLARVQAGAERSL